MPLISPQGWDYVLLLATPAAVCLVDRFSEIGRPWQLVTAAAFAFMSFTIYDLLGRALYVRMMALSVVSVAAIVLVDASCSFDDARLHKPASPHKVPVTWSWDAAPFAIPASPAKRRDSTPPSRSA